ncbi:hypothetical protein TNCV_3093141 [Trichonephila clavipes]|nr:hypothetical protein TNCV_3093141 [Trichonephila clavipes]
MVSYEEWERQSTMHLFFTIADGPFFLTSCAARPCVKQKIWMVDKRCDQSIDHLKKKSNKSIFSHEEPGKSKKGCVTEAVAKQQFLTYLSDQHVNGMLLSCGLLVDKENIFLRATPDGLVMCDCCETALLEIKCPARGKGFVVEQIPRKNFFLDDSLNLKRNHVYFDQIQGQMDIWKLSRCYEITST